ncbi:citrinin biosynthesis oxidoreductase-like protein CtnB [Westerdykella ornata]|uniref:Citrinin biosynthesis oxidoreductase-like protein CtnB n=1 Tax=Westerdykella ornata TaxID=318751 RepID=A0A6A6JIK4_WESOR|nr:citrinin biosynthesis oxidoreductase-like protein CtnB [Westerdykella ornata]KAF2275476.1 citrinin biosynthesis oxidoreductase-like protein CtnB [Westerdykella ornata]
MENTYITPSASPRSGSEERNKPALLAFHGSGSNGTIHTVQLARLSRLLKQHFEIVALEAPYPSAAGPGILPFFEGCGPFKRWLPPQEKTISVDGMKRGEASGTMPPEVETLIRSTVSDIEASGGKVVGAIGFSQGTRIVAGLLKGAQVRRMAMQQGREVDADSTRWLEGFKFGLSVCGSYPPPLVPACVASIVPPGDAAAGVEEKIDIPTLHIQGKQDEWEWAGELLIAHYALGEGKSEVWRLDMGHHYPVALEENEKIYKWVLEQWTRSEGGGQVEKTV